MRRALLVLLVLFGLPLLVLLLAGDNGRTAIHAELMDADPPAPPDYADPAAWAALPTTPDAADRSLVPGTSDLQSTAAADVFFLYAGSNWSFHWNAPLDHWSVRFLVDGPLLEQWASAFNGCCRVYVPRYRQEAIGYPQGHAAEHVRSLEVAAEDVRAAFRHYLAHYNNGRPFIIAGAQSGGRHALRLLIEEVAGKPVRRQLVAAYVAGARVDAAARQSLGDIRICGAPTATGCVNAWSAVGRQAEVVEPRPGETCVNPLTWRADEAHAPKELNLGTIGGRLWGSGPPQFDSGLVDAQCRDGWLWITPPEGRWFWQPDGPGDYHIQNYMFFFANIRDNAIERVEAFTAKSG
jgi:hypothetical protein